MVVPTYQVVGAALAEPISGRTKIQEEIMDSGASALVSGFIVFVAVTTAVILLDDEPDKINAMTIGGLTGGAVALNVWLSESQRKSTDA